MSRVMSFRDLRLISLLSGMNEVEMIHPKNDELVYGILGNLGFNTKAPIQYIPSKHRDMQGNIGVGFQAVGTVSLDKEFLRHPVCHPMERLAAYSLQDPSWAFELAKMMGNNLDLLATEDAEPDTAEEWPEDQTEPDYEIVLEEIQLLEEIRNQLRGPEKNEAGALKVQREYAEWYAAVGA